ncbi:MAG: 3-hydroxyacyl-CoA dehydrogenase NAD-binding domain-containing protein [Neisseria sp.]|nr:3-hydroxyacyl-CoA dehydrogenase NAD-binding domain-containing protein [Neisseria sp.]
MNQRTVAVIGGGTIGLSWACLFAAKGFMVKLYDPRPDLAESLSAFAPAALADICTDNTEKEAARQRIAICADLTDTLNNVCLIQEAGPENTAFKQNFWQQAEQLAPQNALFCSSSSGIPASVQNCKMKQPRRLLIAHPFNPPHLLPLVEISAADNTPDSAFAPVMAFYREIGKYPVRLRREIDGFVANRLQIALVNEAIHLIDSGVCTPQELDDIVTHSLGIRWAAIGPLQAFHLGGGTGGLAQFMQHIGIGLAAHIGQETRFDAAVLAKVTHQTETDYPLSKRGLLCRRRDRKQAAILAALQDANDMPD